MTVTITLERHSGAPRRRRLRSILGRVQTVLAGQVKAVRKTASGSKAMANLRSVPLTVAGLASIDAAFLTWHLFAGLLVLGASFFYLEHVIADEQ